MKLVVFGLTLSSAWGNGHAAFWRGLIRALAKRGHRVTFFERDAPYYSATRDLRELPGCRLLLYESWTDVVHTAREELRGADAGLVTSFCPDGSAATELLLGTPGPVHAFYDLDTLLTLDAARKGRRLTYLGPTGLAGFDLVLSITGGGALTELRGLLGARNVAPLYPAADPARLHPAPSDERFHSDLSYLGNYTPDRLDALQNLFLDAARARPGLRCVLAGAHYPPHFPWASNIWRLPRVLPEERPAFFSSCRLALVLTRRPLAPLGSCPPAQLFDAAACGAPIATDGFDGLEAFFEPGRELLVTGSTEELLAALAGPDAELRRIGQAGRERVLRDHSAATRAEELVELLRAPPEGTWSGSRVPASIGVPSAL